MKLQQQIKEWKEWCENDEDIMNDHIRDLFNEQIEKKDLFLIINNIDKLNIEDKKIIDEMQEIVQKYFKNILNLPCPDFRKNLKD